MVETTRASEGEIRDFGTETYKILGTRPIRHDGTDKVTGRAVYGGDVRLPGMLYGQILRSPHAHARIRRIDTTQAEALAGVRAVVTAADLPEVQSGSIDLGEGHADIQYMRDNILAGEKVLYRGHAVAGVAASSLHVAEEALALIEVEYEVLDIVADVETAMQESATLLHESLTTQEFSEDSGRKSNIASHIRHEMGNVASAFADAAFVAQAETRTATVHQGYIEPHNGTAVWSPDGQLTIWTSTQGSFTAQKQLATILDLPVSKVRVIPQEIGGGFGGKIPVYVEPIAALLSRKSGHPVKIIMTRADVFESTGPTPGSYVRVKMATDAAGKLVAGEAQIALEAGAYPRAEIGAAAMCVFSCYAMPNAIVDGYDVVVNKPKSAPYRAPGATQVTWPVEKVMDDLAQQLGKDPISFRLENAAEEGTRRVDGIVYPRIGGRQCLEVARDSDHYQSELFGPYRGRSMAIGYWFNLGLKSAVIASVNADSTVHLVEGSTDIGGTRTTIAMQFAETLGLSATDIYPSVGDTSATGLSTKNTPTRIRDGWKIRSSSTSAWPPASASR